MLFNATVSVGAILGALIVGGSASPAGLAGRPGHVPEQRAPPATGYTFQTLDNPAYPKYNVLTGISNAGMIAGYYGGDAQQPAQGYTLAPPYGSSNYTLVHIKHALQTQVLAIDNLGNILGNYLVLDRMGHYRSKSFVVWSGQLTSYDGALSSLSGLNDSGDSLYPRPYRRCVVNCYGTRILEYNILTGASNPIHHVPGAQRSGFGINDAGDAVGSDSIPHILGVSGWARVHGRMYSVNFPGSGLSTVARGINNNDEIVGTYGDFTSNHGFVLTNATTNPQYETVDDPRGVGTSIYGVNDSGQLVGSYIDSSGNTHGFLATPG